MPRDLSVVGFDNIPESALHAPSLTTIDQHVQELGYHAMQLLVRLIRGEPTEEIHITLPTELVGAPVHGPTRPPVTADHRSEPPAETWRDPGVAARRGSRPDGADGAAREDRPALRHLGRGRRAGRRDVAPHQHELASPSEDWQS